MYAIARRAALGSVTSSSDSAFRRAITAVVSNARLRRVGLAYAFYKAAESGVWIAMLVYAYAQGGAATAGAVAALQLVPAALLAPMASTLVDRCGPGRVLVRGYVAQAAALGVTAAALLAACPPGAVYGLAVVVTCALTLTRPSQYALVPALTRTQDELTAVNAVTGWIDSAGMLAGPVLAGILLGAGGGAGIVFAVLALGVTASALLVASIMGAPGPAAAAAAGDGARDDVAAGFRLLKTHPEARAVVGLLGAQYVIIGALDVLFVVLAVDVLDLGESGAGYLNGAFGAGGVIGLAATAALVGRSRLMPALVSGIAAWWVACALIAVWPGTAGALLLLAAAGAGRSLFDVAGRTLLQRSASSDLLGRVFGILEGLSMAGLAVGALLAPALVDAGGSGLALATIATLLPVLAVVYRRRLLTVDLQADVPVVEVALLRSLPMVAALTSSEIERLARNLEARSVRAGEVVIREGDVADVFYVVAEGELEVIRDGVSVGSLARPDGFGEIGLLEDRPRTASVVARADGVVMVLGGEDFLTAMNRQSHGAREARRLARYRLTPATAS